MKRTTENFPRMKNRGWARRNRLALSIRSTTRAFRRIGVAADVATDAFGDFVIALAGLETKER